MDKIDVKNVTTRKQYLNRSFRETFKSTFEVEPQLSKKKNVEQLLINQFTLGQPIYIGFKQSLMQDFYLQAYQKQI